MALLLLEKIGDKGYLACVNSGEETTAVEEELFAQGDSDVGVMFACHFSSNSNYILVS